MLFEELMMDHNTLIKFKIYKKISNLNQNKYSVSQLALSFDLNYQQTLLLLTEINQEIMDHSKQQPSILEKAGKLNITSLVVSVDDYRYLLLKKSIPFLFIFYFINHDQPTIEDFCNRHYVSQSTVSRKMIPLKKHVKQFNLRFSLRESNLTGDERVVRVALFNVFWLGTRGMEWPFETVPEEDALALVKAFESYFPLSNTYLGTRELSYFAAIFLARTRKKFFVKYDKAYDFLMKDNSYYDFKRLNEILGPVKMLPPNVVKAESSFIFFLSHYAPFYTDENDPSYLQLMRDFSRGNNAVQVLVSDFLEHIKNELFYVDPQLFETPLLKTNLFNIFFVFHVLQQPLPNLQTLVDAQSKRPLQIDAHLDRTIKSFLDAHDAPPYAYFASVEKYLTRTLKNLLLPYCNQFPYSKRLKVGMAFEHNFLAIRSLYHFLERLEFIEVCPYLGEPPDAYDLVISSSLLPLKTYPDLPLYFMDLSFEDEELATLYIRLHQLFKKKNTTLP